MLRQWRGAAQGHGGAPDGHPGLAPGRLAEGGDPAKALKDKGWEVAGKLVVGDVELAGQLRHVCGRGRQAGLARAPAWAPWQEKAAALAAGVRRGGCWQPCSRCRWSSQVQPGRWAGRSAAGGVALLQGQEGRGGEGRTGPCQVHAGRREQRHVLKGLGQRAAQPIGGDVEGGQVVDGAGEQLVAHLRQAAGEHVAREVQLAQPARVLEERGGNGACAARVGQAGGRVGGGGTRGVWGGVCVWGAEGAGAGSRGAPLQAASVRGMRSMPGAGWMLQGEADAAGGPHQSACCRLGAGTPAQRRGPPPAASPRWRCVRGLPGSARLRRARPRGAASPLSAQQTSKPGAELSQRMRRCCS
jgi:hypothetical protein